MKGCYAFHKDLKNYRWPYLVVFSINVERMKCPQCQKEKDALIYTNDLIFEASTKINKVIIEKIKGLHDKAIVWNSIAKWPLLRWFQIVKWIKSLFKAFHECFIVMLTKSNNQKSFMLSYFEEDRSNRQKGFNFLTAEVHS